MTRYIADLHLGHKAIHKFAGEHRGGVSSLEEHDQWIIDRWNSVVRKNDVTWVLGDAAFSNKGLEKIKKLNGVKHLLLGNHDDFSIDKYKKYFNKVTGFHKKASIWFSHPPIHEESLRNLVNVHGHTHHRKVYHPGYFCVSVEPLGGIPISLDEIIDRAGWKEWYDGIRKDKRAQNEKM